MHVKRGGSMGVLSKRAKEIIGTNGVKRFNNFKLLESGWDCGKGEILSPHSVAAMNTFIADYSGVIRDTSIFLTLDGNLQLQWKNLDGKYVEIEFFAEHMEYYDEASDDEGVVKLSDISTLISKLS